MIRAISAIAGVVRGAGAVDARLHWLTDTGASVVPVLSLLDADMIARGVSHGDVAGSPGLGDGLL